jgi:hypothetical protein
MSGQSSGQKVFLERPSYGRRRLADAARVLPVAGAAFLAVPVLWPDRAELEAGVEPVAMSDAILYVFGVWIGLIVLAAIFGAWSQGDPGEPSHDPRVRGGPSAREGR